MAAQGLIEDVSQLIANDINGMNAKQTKDLPAVNTRELIDDEQGIPVVKFTNELMQEILNTATQFNISDEYLSIVREYRANIIDPETGLSYFACNDYKIDNSIKKVSFINDKVYEIINANDKNFKNLNLKFNFRKFYETKNNLYYDVSYMYNLLSKPGILKIPEKIKKLNPSFKDLIDFILKQSILDFPRNNCNVIIGEEKFEFPKKLEDETDQTYFDKVVTQNFKNIYDTCFEKTNDIFITSKILFGIIMVFTQTFDALDIKIYADLGFSTLQDSDFLKTITVDLDKNVISSCKLFITRIINEGNIPPFIVYSQSSILYKCYDFINDSIYTNIIFIIPKKEKLSYSPEIIKSVNSQLENFGDSHKHKTEKVDTTDILFPNTYFKMEKITYKNVKIKRGANNSGENIDINLEFPSSWGNKNIFDFIISQQLIGGKYLPAISKISEFNSISELFTTCDFNKEILRDLISEFLVDNTRDIKIIKSIIISTETGLEYPVFFLLRKIINKTGAVLNLIYYTSPSILPKSDISKVYTQIIKSFAGVVGEEQYYPVEYIIDTKNIIDRSNDAGIRLLSLLSLFSLINGIISIGDGIAKPIIKINNFHIFISQLKLLLENWHFFENKKLEEVEKVENVETGTNVVTRKLLEGDISNNSTSTSKSGRRTIRKTSGARQVSRKKSLNGGRRLLKHKTEKKIK